MVNNELFEFPYNFKVLKNLEILYALNFFHLGKKKKLYNKITIKLKKKKKKIKKKKNITFF